MENKKIGEIIGENILKKNPDKIIVHDIKENIIVTKVSSDKENKQSKMNELDKIIVNYYNYDLTYFPDICDNIQIDENIKDINNSIRQIKKML